MRFLATISVLILSFVKIAQATQITDISGQELSLKAPVQRILLGEGRLIYALAILEKNNPFKRIVGWSEDLKKADPQSCFD